VRGNVAARDATGCCNPFPTKSHLHNLSSRLTGLSERGVGEGFAHLVVAEAAVAFELAVVEELVEG
jgi:hypothetical protein